EYRFIGPRRRRQVVRQRSAKPPPPVQIRAAPPKFLNALRRSISCSIATFGKSRRSRTALLRRDALSFESYRKLERKPRQGDCERKLSRSNELSPNSLFQRLAERCNDQLSRPGDAVRCPRLRVQRSPAG